MSTATGTETVLAWHFLADDRRLQFGERQIVKVGQTFEAKGPLELCENGLHGSMRMIDALQYAKGSILCRTEHGGEIVRGDDKLCSRKRKCLAMGDVSKVLQEFACQVAEQALKSTGVKDEHCWSAIQMKRNWLIGKATDKELAAAGDAQNELLESLIYESHPKLGIEP